MHDWLWVLWFTLFQQKVEFIAGNGDQIKGFDPLHAEWLENENCVRASDRLTPDALAPFHDFRCLATN